MNSTVKRNRTDTFFAWVFKTTGILCSAILAGIFGMLLYNSIAFFIHINPIDFITSTQWNPGHNDRSSIYGLLPLLASTLMVTFGAMCIADLLE